MISLLLMLSAIPGTDYEQVRAEMGWSTPAPEAPDIDIRYPELETEWTAENGRSVFVMVFLDKDGKQLYLYAAGTSGRLAYVGSCSGSAECPNPDFERIERESRNFDTEWKESVSNGMYWELREVLLSNGFIPDYDVRVGSSENGMPDGVMFMESSLYMDLDEVGCTKKCDVTWVSVDGVRIRATITGTGPNLSYYTVSNIRG